MRTVTVQSLYTLKKSHPEVVGSLRPVDNVKYVTSGIGSKMDVPDEVAGIYAARGKDNTGNYYKFHYLPAPAMGYTPVVAATSSPVTWEWNSRAGTNALVYEYRLMTDMDARDTVLRQMTRTDVEFDTNDNTVKLKDLETGIGLWVPTHMLGEEVSILPTDATLQNKKLIVIAAKGLPPHSRLQFTIPVAFLWRKPR